MGKVAILFSWAPKSLWTVTVAMKLKVAWKKSCDKLRQHIKKQRHYFADKGRYSQSDVFSSSHIQMWELDRKQVWTPKNWCFWLMVLEKTLENPLEIKPVNPKENQGWIFFGRTDAEAPVLSSSHAKNWLIGKDPDTGKDWGQEEKAVIEDEMSAWHHWLNGHEFQQSQRDSEGQGSLVCCSPWGRRVRHNLVTEQQLHKKW